MGKRKMSDSDSEGMDEDDTDEDEDKENEKSVIIDNGSHSDSSKEVEARSGSITGGKLAFGSVDGSKESLKSVRTLDVCSDDGIIKSKGSPVLESPEETKDYTEVISQVPDKSLSSTVNEVVSQQPGTCSPDVKLVSAAQAKDDSSKSNLVVEESVCISENLKNVKKPLNSFSSRVGGSWLGEIIIRTSIPKFKVWGYSA